LKKQTKKDYKKGGLVFTLVFSGSTEEAELSKIPRKRVI
jgi:hypothetical protein